MYKIATCTRHIYHTLIDNWQRTTLSKDELATVVQDPHLC